MVIFEDDQKHWGIRSAEKQIRQACVGKAVTSLRKRLSISQSKLHAESVVILT
jgi:hypothetical protein